MVDFSAKELSHLREIYDRIPQLLKENCCVPENRNVPVLLAGAGYNGIWIEHNQDAFFAADIMPETAWASQEIFMEHQRADGLLPAAVRFEPQVIRYAQLQMVWPFARCAMEVAGICQRKEEDFARIYRTALHFDEFLQRYRNRSGKGLVDMFCEYDTGHDRSPRVCDGGIPHSCPGGDAANMPDLPCMPVAAADLSATRFGALEAMAELAEKLGDSAAAARHREQAAELKAQIYKFLYSTDDDFFYDLSAQGSRKYRTEHITRLFLNRVVDQEHFDRIYGRYFAPGKAFFTGFPYPSVSPEDPSFCRELPDNSWAGNTQMLTLIRALIWMPCYGKTGDLKLILTQFLRAYCDHENNFSQELSPFDGSPIGSRGGYTPAMLLFRAACDITGVLK